jgi:hypothetical protein
LSWRRVRPGLAPGGDAVLAPKAVLAAWPDDGDITMPMKPGSTKNLLLRLDPELAGRLRTVAGVEGRPVSDVVREVIAALAGQRGGGERFRRLPEEDLARRRRALDLLRDDRQ